MSIISTEASSVYLIFGFHDDMSMNDFKTIIYFPVILYNTKCKNKNAFKFSALYCTIVRFFSFITNT